MEYGFLFFGISIGIVIGTQYIPHQIKKGNKKVINYIRQLLEEFER
ncbi:MAG: hypothetical protein K0S22_1026 [Oscillospiraceae bacterium]|jgi:hypothetical protein|nr:hypothetical protein [Oscillospiraceae bacterium]